MYWLQTIRQHLHLNQEELAAYLGLSIHTIKSVEIGRRMLPINSLKSVIAMFNAIRDSSLRGAAIDATIFMADDRYSHRKKSFHRHCCRKLNKHIGKLDGMQRSYAVASLRLDVYQRLEQTLAADGDQKNAAALKWTQRKAKEAMHGLNENNVTAQHILAAKVASLRSLVSALERPHQELNRDVPEVNKTDNKTQFNDTTTWSSI